MTPGVDFDAVDGHTHMRLSYAGSTADIKKAVTRLTSWLAKQA
jgi:aspartate/methionine/tyrosine aminotransferase